MNDWIKDAIFYQIYPLGFCGAPQYHQCNTTHVIKKIEEWIPHLTKMHINALYLGPVFESYEHGYDTSDYQLVDHRLGSNEDFKEVCQKLHAAGIRIVLDGVFNHVGREFWAFKDVQKNLQASRYCSWFHNLNFSCQSPMQDPFTYEAWEGHYNLVKLNLQNEEVVQYLLDSIHMWIKEFDIDGLRLDAADCIDRNFFRRLKVFCKEQKSDFWLMGEIIHGDYTVWANDEMLDSVTNYECYKGLYSSHNEKNYFEIAYSLNRQFGNGGIYKHLTLYNFVDNHDVNRLASTVKNEQDLYNIYTLLYTMPGIPSMYYGSEWALKGIKHDGSDADIRPCITLADMENESSDLLEHLCTLGAIKKQYKALRDGDYEQIVVRNEQFIFARKNNDEILYVAFNVSDTPYTCEFHVAYDALKDCISNTLVPVEHQTCTLTMKPKTAYVLVSSNEECHKDEIEKIIESEEHIESEDNLSSKDIVEQIDTEAQIEENAHTQIEEKTLVNKVEEGSNAILPGKYQHFKGKHYAVLYIATHSETMEQYVVYRQLYGNGDVWVRPLKMFQEFVEVEGKRVPRFTYIGK